MDEIGCLARVYNRKMAVAREGCFSNAASTVWIFFKIYIRDKRTKGHNKILNCFEPLSQHTSHHWTDMITAITDNMRQLSGPFLLIFFIFMWHKMYLADILFSPHVGVVYEMFSLALRFPHAHLLGLFYFLPNNKTWQPHW